MALSTTDPLINNGNWVHGVMGNLYGATPTSNTDPALIKAGSLFPYSKNVGIYKCPADKKSMAVGGTSVLTSRSMSMNFSMNPAGPWNASLRIYKKLSQITKPSPGECWVFIDECPGTINDAYFVCDPTTPNNWVDIPATYHNSASGISFADGHAELKKWRDPVILKQTSALFSAAGKNPATDLRWLADRSTTSN